MGANLLAAFIFGLICGLVLAKILTKKRPVDNLLNEFKKTIGK